LAAAPISYKKIALISVASDSGAGIKEGSGVKRRCLWVSAVPTTNIPTELLRTLIAVVDLRSFTKAAHALGVTQPAVSAQIKRLQFLLDIELFDKSAPGVKMTDQGELVVNYARRMLSINDQILTALVPGSSVPPLRVGTPGDFASSVLPRIVAEYQARTPQLRIQLRGDPSENLLRDLRHGQLDLAIALTTSGPALDARHYWREEVVWIGRPDAVEPAGRLCVVTLREGGLMHRITTSTLNQIEHDYEIVFMAVSSAGLLAAVAAGLGVAVLPRREVPPNIDICDEAFLPKLPEVYCGIYLRERLDCEMLERLADNMADALRTQSSKGVASNGGVPRVATTGGEIDVAMRAASNAPRA
jgi:DNA-binding transcriptional LysR family regulator